MSTEQMMATITARGTATQIHNATLYSKWNVAQGAALALVYRKVTAS